MPTVDVPSVGLVEFPDSMDQDAISGAIRSHFEKARTAGVNATIRGGLLPLQILTAPGVAEASEMGQAQGRIRRLLNTPPEMPPSTGEQRAASDLLLRPTDDEAYLRLINTPRAMRIAGIRRAIEEKTPDEITPSPESLQAAENETSRWINPPKAVAQTALGALSEAQQAVGLPSYNVDKPVLPPGMGKNIVDAAGELIMPSAPGGSNLGPAGKGISEAASDLIQNLTPADAVAMATGPVGGAGYALEMAHGAPDQAAELGKAIGDKDPVAASKAAVNLAMGVAAPAGLVHGMARLASPRSVPIPDFPGQRLPTPRGAAPEATAAEVLRASPEEAAAQAEQMNRDAQAAAAIEKPKGPAGVQNPPTILPRPEVPVVGPSIEEQRADKPLAKWQDFVAHLKENGTGRETLAQVKDMFREQFPNMSDEQAAALAKNAFGPKWPGFGVKLTKGKTEPIPVRFNPPDNGDEGTPPTEPTPPPDSPPQSPAAPAAPAKKPLPPLRPDPAVPEDQFPPLLKEGDKLVTIQRRDGTTYRAAVSPESAYPKEITEALGISDPRSVHRIAMKDGKPGWSTAFLDPGEKIIEDESKPPVAATKPAEAAPVAPSTRPAETPPAAAAKSGEDLFGEAPKVSLEPEVVRARIVRVLEKLEKEDPRTGRITPNHDLEDQDLHALSKEAADAIGMDWGEMLEMDHGNMIKALRDVLGQIENYKAKGAKPPLLYPAEQAATPGLALARRALRKFQAGKLGADELANALGEIQDVHDLPKPITDAAADFFNHAGSEDEPTAKHKILSELAKALGEKEPEAPKPVAPEVEAPVPPPPPVKPAPPAKPAAPVTPETLPDKPTPFTEQKDTESDTFGPEPKAPGKMVRPDSPAAAGIRKEREALVTGVRDGKSKLRLLNQQISALVSNRTAEGMSKRENLIKQYDEQVQKINEGIDKVRDADARFWEQRWKDESAPYRQPGYKAPEGDQPVTSKMLKEQKSSLLGQARAALKTAPESNKEKITLSVPGDGDFSIFNHKEALKKFIATIEESFPESVAKPRGPTLGASEGKTMPAAVPVKPAKGKTMGETLGTIAGEFMSEDPDRHVIQTGYADGTQIIATDGRRMIRIVNPDAPGKPSAPVRLSAKGKEVSAKGSFPNYKQIWDTKPTLVKGGVPTADLWTIANQAVALTKGTDKVAEIDLFLNPDGTLGGKADDPGIGSYEHNIKPGAKGIGRYNSKYIFDAANALRKLGNEKADLYFHGDPGPLEVRGKNAAVLQMGMADKGTPRNIDADRPHAGKAEHGNLPEMLSPLNGPNELITESAHISGTSSGQKGAHYRVSLENGEYRVERVNPARDKYSKETLDKVASGKLDDISQWKKEAKDIPPGHVKGIQDAIKSAMSERASRIAEGEKREQPPKLSEQATAYLDKAAEEALKRIQSRGGTTFGSGPLHELPNIKDYAIYGAAKLAKLGVRSAEWANEMRKAFGKRIEPHLDKIYDAAKQYLEDYRNQTGSAGKLSSVQQIIAAHTGAEPARLNGVTGAIDALQSSLRTARALKEHFEGQPKVSKTEVKVADDFLEADANKIRESLTELVKNELPVSERGRFITAINNATKRVPILTGDPAAMYRQAARVAARIEERSQEVRKGAAIADLQKTVRSALNSPSVDLGYKKRILELMRRVSFTKPTAETLASLKATREYLDRMDAQGKETQIPREILDQLDLLTKIPLRDMPSEAVHALADKINQLEQLGRLKIESRQRVWDAEKASKLDQLSKENTIPFEKRAQVGSALKSERTTKEDFANALNKRLAGGELLDRAILPIDAGLELLQGGDPYRGWLFRNVRGPLDLAYNAYQVLRDNLASEVEALVKKHKMGEAQAERINLYGIAMMEKGAHLPRLLAQGFTDEQISKVLSTITNEERAVYSAMRKAFDASLPDLQKIMHELYNIDVKPVEDYWPLPREWELTEVDPKDAKEPKFGEKMDFDELAGWQELLKDFRPKTTKTERGMTIERQPKAQTPVQTNAFEVFYRHINDVSYLLKHQRDLKLIGEMVRTDTFKQKYGSLGQTSVIDWLDTVAKQGRLGGLTRWNWLDSLRRRTSAGVISWRLGSQFVHLSSLPLSLKRTGFENYGRALAAVFTDKGQQFMKDNFAETFARGGGEPALIEAAHLGENPLIKQGAYRTAVRWGFSGARAIDRYNSQATALGVYMKELERKGLDPSKYSDLPVDKEAQAYALVQARRAVASPLSKDVSPSLARGAMFGNNVSVARSIQQFQNVFQDQWSNIRVDLWKNGIKARNPKEAAAMVIALTAMIVAETGIREGAKEVIKGVSGSNPKKKEDVGGKVAQEVLRRFPFGGQMTSWALYGESGIPTLDSLVSEGKNLHSAFTAKNPRTQDKALIRAIGGAAQIAGVPGSSQGAELIEKSIK